MQGKIAVISRLGITGSPKTGKTEIGKAVADLLSYPFYDLNKICITNGLGNFNRDEFEVDIRRARRFISNMLLKEECYVISGLLLPTLVRNSLLDSVIVLRCNPKELFLRNMKAGYNAEKSKNNAVCEAIGSVFFEALKLYGRKVIQLDVTNLSVDDVAKVIAKGNIQNDNVDWLLEAEKDSALLRLLL